MLYFNVNRSRECSALEEFEARAILGVSQGVSFGDVKKSYRSLVKAMHPDVALRDSESQKRATNAMGRINEAWECIQALEAIGRLGTSSSTASSAGSSANSSQFRSRNRATLVDECEVCGSWPAIPLIVSTVSTFWIFMRRVNYEGSLCRSCGLATSRYYLKEAMMKGWWGLGIIFMPIVIARSVIAERKLDALGDPIYRDILVITPNELPLMVEDHPIKQPIPLLASVGAIVLIVSSLIPTSGTSDPTQSASSSGSSSGSGLLKV